MIKYDINGALFTAILTKEKLLDKYFTKDGDLLPEVTHWIVDGALEMKEEGLIKLSDGMINKLIEMFNERKLPILKYEEPITGVRVD